MNKLAMRDDLIRMREECVQAAEYETKLVLVCGGTGCVSGGSLDIYAKLKELMEEKGLPVDLDLAEDPHREVIGIKRILRAGSARKNRAARVAVLQGQG